MKAAAFDVNVALPKIDAFPDRVDFLIQRHGSASEVARLSGSSDTVVRKWRNGESDPSRERCIALAKGAGVPLLWLMTGEMPDETAQLSQSQGVSVDVATLTQAIYVFDGVMARLSATMTPADQAETLLMLVDYIRENAGALSPSNVVSLLDHIARKRSNEPR